MGCCVTREEWMALRRRAVASSGWRWMPGMRAVNDIGLQLRLVRGGLVYEDEEGPAMGGPSAMHAHLDTAWADLSDPATLGALVFGVLPEQGILLSLSLLNPDRCVGWHQGDTWHGQCGPTAETAVAALEAA